MDGMFTGDAIQENLLILNCDTFVMHSFLYFNFYLLFVVRYLTSYITSSK